MASVNSLLNRRLSLRERRRLKVSRILPADAVDPEVTKNQLKAQNVQFISHFGNDLSIVLTQVEEAKELKPKLLSFLSFKGINIEKINKNNETRNLFELIYRSTQQFYQP